MPDAPEAGRVVEARGAGPRHVVVTVHGIRTFGGWQSRLARLVREAKPGCEFRSFKFNYFSALAFWFPPTRWLVVRRFAREMDRLGARGGIGRLDVVAHSFGTHVVAWGLRKARRAPRVNTLVLSGSVLRASHVWDEMIPARVGRVVNECGHRDGILVLSQAFVPLTGMAGRVGFVGLLGPDFQNRYFDFGHSGYFQDRARKPDDAFMRENWVPLLTGDSPVPEIDRRGEATPLTGIQLTLLQWLDPVKMAVLWSAVVLAFLYLLGLWADAAMTRDRLAAATDLVRSAAEREQRIPAEDADAIVAALGLPLGTSRVLWVDEEPGNNTLERRALRRWNVCFTNVRSGAEAERALRERPGAYALVLSDWKRPGEEGGATAGVVRALPEGSRPPLVFYVSPGSATEDNRREARRLGAADETGNPFRLFSLSLRELARGGPGSGGVAAWMPATLATGAAWISRRFMECDAD